MGSTTISATIKPIVAPQYHFSWIDPHEQNDDRQRPSQHARQFYNQTRGFISGTARLFACNASNNSNLYVLSLQTSGPIVETLNTIDTYGFIAPATSTGLITASIVSSSGKTMIPSSIKVFKTNGSAQATTNDITINLQYFFTFVDSLDSGNGGFVLR